mmetsp:Transcript_39858/g.119939  ORF Transcript_39858/g.119939 Transcript_39858/m.119939 type:complete len:755 (-) Transcript_39858:80-2344(-)
MHIDFSYCSDKTPIIYYHSTKKSRPSDVSLDDLESLNDTHCPFLFIDESSAKPLPSPEVLSKFRIVITTSQRIMMEWKYGSFEEEIEIAKDGGTTSYRDFYLHPEELPAASSLLKVHWLRLVVDEGHSMGRGVSNSIQFASWVTAQRRWAMTGTPTQQTASSSGLRNINGLMNFLQHDFFRPVLGGSKFWSTSITRGWNEGHLSSFFRLHSLLSLLLVRHTKENIEEIPSPVFINTFIDMSKEEIQTYNTLVSAVQQNITTTSMEGKTSGWQDSLLNPRQSRSANEALKNMRIICAGGSRMLPEVTPEHWAETLAFLREKHDCDEIKVTLVHNYLHRATTGELSGCMCCGMQVQTLFVVPCACLVCTECIDSKTKSCPVCELAFDTDDFQLLQPGMKYDWLLNLESEQRERESKGRLKRQLSVRNQRAGGNEDEHHFDVDTANEHGHPELIIAPPRHRRRAHECTYSSQFTDGKCDICNEEHFSCNFMSGSPQCLVCNKRYEDCPAQSSKAFYVCKKLLELRSTYHETKFTSLAASRVAGELVVPQQQRPLKAIIFSQYRTIMDYFGDRLYRRFGGACIADYFGASRNQELLKFAKSPDCFCMLLCKDGSHGLDLSFVTHIFFLDTIYDKALENQVVARAFRMGATSHVTVEKLIAKQSVEENMLKLNDSSPEACCMKESQDVDGVTRWSSSSVASLLSSEEKQTKQAKLHFLLKSSRLIQMVAKKRKFVDSQLRDANSENTGNDHSSARVRFA